MGPNISKMYKSAKIDPDIRPGPPDMPLMGSADGRSPFEYMMSCRVITAGGGSGVGFGISWTWLDGFLAVLGLQSPPS